MSRVYRPPVTAVIGPTNTGKTHLAVERLCAHSSGMMGFPLRLLAREIYERVVAIKGAAEVGLITGEEKIMPAGARWLLCTAEAMPVDRDVAFVALDEAQLGADPERGHIFTDRLLRARGREETMILGSSALAPVLGKLVPEADIVRRPRFSTLSFGGAKKLARLPKRTAIVAFSTAEVYATAEMLRRTRGGAAVVTGALSPRTRNAQVAMFMAGEVDYLVATDAIGMGLNLAISHVAFAGLSKFDGRRVRRLTIAEMAQIAGRAGRHHSNGTFGSLGAEDGPSAFRPDEIEAIEAHRFPKLEALFWRQGELDYSSVEGLLGSLQTHPDGPALMAAPEAVDLAILRLLAEDRDVRAKTRSVSEVHRLWSACGIPDFQKIGADHHARLVSRVYRHLSEMTGHIPVSWIADEIARLDRIDGDIDTLGGRIAAVRTWSYIAQRPDWLEDTAHWIERSRAVEDKLSDALHKKLTERFVDRKLSALRDMSTGRSISEVSVNGDDGEVSIRGQYLGRLQNFAFAVDASARGDDRARLRAAVDRALAHERRDRAQQLSTAANADLALRDDGAVLWREGPVGWLTKGRSLVTPRIRPDASLQILDAADRERIVRRLGEWASKAIEKRIFSLRSMAEAATDRETSPAVRGILATLTSAGGTISRCSVDKQLDVLSAEDRFRLARSGLTIGTLDVFDARLLKPEAQRWISILQQVAGQVYRAPLRTFGGQPLRVDLVEKIIRNVHIGRTGRASFSPDPALALSMGLDRPGFAELLRSCGFRLQSDGQWRWRSRPRPKVELSSEPTGALAQALESWTAG